MASSTFAHPKRADFPGRIVAENPRFTPPNFHSNFLNMMETTKKPTLAPGLTFAMFIALFLPWTVKGQEVIQKRGADTLVRYESLKRFGPWDDRNYRVTSEDLRLLAPNEEEQKDPIPVFFRVQLRKQNPNLRRTGPAQYPRSAVPLFLQLYGGYMVNDKLYQRVEMERGQYKVIEDGPSIEKSEDPSRFLLGEERVTSPIGAAESAIKINPVNPNLVIAGTNGPGPGQNMFFSTDGGENWATASLPFGNTCCDPTVDWSSDGLVAYTATLSNNLGVWFYRSSDNGQTWTDLQNVTPGDPRRELTNSGSDKEFLHVDKHIGSPHIDNVYLTWHNSNVMQFARSTDRGNTWTTTSFAADPVGIGSDIVTDRNGNIYYFYPGTGARQILLKRSTNGGATFLPGTVTVSATNGSFDFPIPSIETRRAWIYVSADADLSTGPFGGSIYAAWTDTYAAEDETNANNNHTRIQVARSRDGGATWNVVTPHEIADQNTVDRWNQWLAVGRDGTVHIIFYDTRNSVGRTGVDLYYSFSTDGGVTFSAPQRLTSAVSPNLGDTFEFGDYNGLDHVVCQIAIYTDSRNEGVGGGDSPDVYTIGTDNQPPSITCPPNLTLNASPGLCSAPAAYTANATDACTPVSLSYNPPTGTLINVGTTSVSATATDGAGNTASCNFSVKVVDNQAPAISCPPNKTVNNDPNLCSAKVTYTVPIGTDNCPGATTLQTSGLPSNGIFPVGVTTNGFKVTDATGLMATCQFTVTVVDNQPPSITCPVNLTLSCESPTDPSVTGNPVATDNCGIASVGHTDVRIDGSCTHEFTLNRTWKATDIHGNVGTCLQVIKVEDKKAPTITCPANVTVTCDTTAATTGFATALDNCDLNVSISRRNIHVSGDCEWFCITNREWTATDDCRNTSKCVQVITKDVTPLIEQALLGGPLVWGQKAATVTLPPGRGNCVVKWLPYSGTVPTALKFDDAVAGADCRLMSNPLDGSGHIVNPLLGEAMKLKILVRLNPALGNLRMKADLNCDMHFIVSQALAGKENATVNELLRVTDLTLGNVNVSLLVPAHTQHLLDALKCVNRGRSVCNP